MDVDFTFSDEAHCTLVGNVNKQNGSICGSENPQVIEERPLNLEKVTVWCVLWSEGVIRPYFFKNDDGTTVTVNSERYVTWRICGFNKIALLQGTFTGRVMSRRGDISCDFMRFDTIRLLLYGYAKDCVYAINLQFLST